MNRPMGAHASFEEDVNARLGSYIKRAEQALIGAKTSILRGFDLTVPQYAAMMSLLYSGGESAANLARVALVTPQTMATILKNLEAKGLVERNASTLHARVVVNSLTDSGEALVLRADKQVRRLEKELSAIFTPDTLEAFRKALERSEEFLREAESSNF